MEKQTNILENLAQEASKREIYKAIKEKRDELFFTGSEFNLLSIIPSEILKVDWLKKLDLSGTKIKEISHLANLKELEGLWLEETEVENIDPLQGLINLTELSLSSSRVQNISAVCKLKKLRGLGLANLKVSDIRDLSDLAMLERVDLSDSAVLDLRPILNLPRLGLERGTGVTFRDCVATHYDKELKRISLIERINNRTEEALSYLKSLPKWPEPYKPKNITNITLAQAEELRLPDPPEQDTALPLIWGDNGFDFFANNIDTDPVTEAALAELRASLDDLRRKGNLHDDLYRIAGELQERSTGAISGLNMVKLHLSYQKLRRLHKGRASRPDKFDNETVSSMEAVFDVLPGVTLADGGVRVLIERQAAEQTPGLSAAQDAVAEKMLQDVQDPDAPFAPAVKDIAAEVLLPGVKDRLTGTRRILSNNVVFSALVYVSMRAIDGAIAGPVGNFVYNNGRDLLAYAATMGDDTLFWAESVVVKFRVEYELAMGIAREIAGASVPPTKPPPRSRRGF